MTESPMEDVATVACHSTVGRDPFEVAAAATANLAEIRWALGWVSRQRRYALAELVASGRRPSELARDLGMSRQQLYRLLSEVTEDHLKAFEVRFERDEWEVLALRLGFFGEEAQTLAETADRLGLTVDAVRRIESTAYAKARKFEVEGGTGHVDVS